MDSIPTDTSTVSAITGLLIPLLIAVIIRTGWKRSYQEAAAFGTCAAAAVVIGISTGSLNSSAPVEAFGVVYTTARATFLLVWKPSGTADKIEKATG